MLIFPNSKINLGLRVLRKRADGFHDLESVFYPVNWCDALEVVKGTDTASDFEFSSTGLKIEGDVKDNLVYRCFKLVKELYPLPSIRVHLHKNIPMGAGLGGGSSDAAHFLLLLDKKFRLGMRKDEQYSIATRLGSDCAFFLTNTACLVKGRGELLEPIGLDLSNFFILLVFPGIYSNTAKAYSSIVPDAAPEGSLKQLLQQPVEKWKNTIVNDFDEPVFRLHPEIKHLKGNLYEQGAVYVAMSGSGSCVFALFRHKPHYKGPFPNYLQKPQGVIL